MNQQPSWQPQEPPDGQQVFGQQEWKQDLPAYQLSLYNQLSQATPGQFQRPPNANVPPPRRQSGIWKWYTSRTKKVKLSIGCSVILALLLFFSYIGTAVGSVHHVTPSAPTPTTGHNQAAVTSPGVRNQPTPILTPTQYQTPQPTLAPTHAPPPTQPPKPTSPPCQAVNNNPWCYNFLPGKLIYSPPADFCTYFACIPGFVEPDDPGNGYLVQCGDGLFSQSGGGRGACWHHGGVSRPLYSH
jgi:hypothetical protein